MATLLQAAATALLIGALSLGSFASQAAAGDILIGTGSKQGVYFQIGRAICHMINRIDPVEGLRCRSQSSPGSVANIQAIRGGLFQVGLVQSDIHARAVAGEGRFAAFGPDTGLRSLFSIHTEPFTVVVRQDSSINTLDDLKGHRVNIGNPGSGQRETMMSVMQAKGWTLDDFALATQLSASEHSFALCNNRVEAVVYSVGHPNPSVAQATGLCNARIIAVTGPEIDDLVANSPFYANTIIPGGIYSANSESVATFGVIATVVVSAELNEETAYQIVAHVFNNIDYFRAAHPALGALDPSAMRSAGLSAPLHPGAQRYFAEQELLAPAPGG